MKVFVSIMQVYVRILTYDSVVLLCHHRITSFSSHRRPTRAELHPHSARLSTSAGMDVLISSSRCECAQMKVASRNACAPSSRLCTITAHLCTPNRGGQALLRSALNYCISRSPIQWCMSFHSRTSWGNCRWFQQEMTAPFPGKCTAARKRAIHLACATVRDPLALEAPCSTSTPGP